MHPSSSPTSLARCQPMGVKGLLKKLHGGNVEDHRIGFSTLGILNKPTRPPGINTGTLVFVFALQHKETFSTGG